MQQLMELPPSHVNFSGLLMIAAQVAATRLSYRLTLPRRLVLLSLRTSDLLKFHPLAQHHVMQQPLLISPLSCHAKIAAL